VERSIPMISGAQVPARVLGVRDFVVIGLRWRKRVALAFLVTLAIAIAATPFWPRSYESVMKILVKRERLDPLSGGDQNAARRELAEEELSAEIELLRSEDVLRNVVLTTGLRDRTREPLWFRFSRPMGASSEEVRTQKAVRGLADRLSIKLPKSSSVITVAYSSDDPRLGANVLSRLSRLYIDKHMTMNRAPEQFEFFNQQAEDCRRKLAAVWERLAQSGRLAGAAEPKLELGIAVQKLGDLRINLQQAETGIVETRNRIRSLETQLASASPRMTTAVRTSENPQLMMQLKSTLLTLELKRTELLSKFQPTYPAVVEVDQQIAKARSAVEAAERSPALDQTTDRDPNYEWLRSELAKSRTELEALRSRASSVATYVHEYESRSDKLNERTLKQQDLLSVAAALEDSYRLYLRKREEARISDALDRRRILNVSIAQEPTVPVLPATSPWMTVIVGAVIAILVAIGAGLGSEYADNSFRSAYDVTVYLDVPVIASLPRGGITKHLE
jgi:uncharacterized protein involved in exopolysaccharide biosynthesis